MLFYVAHDKTGTVWNLNNFCFTRIKNILWHGWNNKHIMSIMQTLMFPSILRLVSCRRSSSSGARGPSRCSNASDALERFSNSVRHLFRSSRRKVQGLFGGSKFGASSDSLLHNCAYIELYLGSSRAFSKICNTKRMHVTLWIMNLEVNTVNPELCSVQFNSVQNKVIYLFTIHFNTLTSVVKVPINMYTIRNFWLWQSRHQLHLNCTSNLVHKRSFFFSTVFQRNTVHSASYYYVGS